ncbi:MAG: hypothetical protein DRG31_02365 [Deltaproteobacteria bacterium]|nr:MAG: hypothetical protein DRG31_02365 [Deltaproteobacteria bacterium]
MLKVELKPTVVFHCDEVEFTDGRVKVVYGSPKSVGASLTSTGVVAFTFEPLPFEFLDEMVFIVGKRKYVFRKVEEGNVE